MQKFDVPNTGLRASRIVLGTDYFGSTVSDELSMRLMDRYLEAGGNVIDTAELYARWVPGGEFASERVIGQWLRERGCRKQVILSTKGAHPNLETMHIPRLSKADIQSDLDSSLRRLGVEQVDIYWLHRDAQCYPVDEVMQTLESFRQNGKIRYAGFSNWTQARAEQARQTALLLGVQGFVASQNMWSLAIPNKSQVDPTWALMDKPFVNWHVVNGFAAFPYLTQASGYFRRLERNTLDQLPQNARTKVLFDYEENQTRFKRIQHIQKEKGLSVSQIVMGYLIAQPFPVFPLIGPKLLADLEDTLHNADSSLDQADISYLERGEPEKI